MRNLKKILALVLALVMSLSLMMTASAATDFKDDGSIESYREAIEVLHGLGVFNGDQDGNFNPTSEITRAEVAAIIYRIATGDVTGDNKTSYSVYGNQFTDVLDEDWFAGYVSYCHNAGYIKGHGDGSFGPNEPVTGYQALAMILRAVGYDRNGEFTGDNWQINTASFATERGVLKNTAGAPLGANASRELVAEILFQSILLNKVNWNAITNSYTQSEDSLAKANLGMERLQGVVVANEYADLDSNTTLPDNRTRLDVEGTAYTLNIASGMEDLGESRYAYVKRTNNNTYDLVVAELYNTGLNQIKDNEGAPGSVSSFAAGTSLASAKYYIDFGEGNTYKASEYTIRYVIDLTQLASIRSSYGYLTGASTKDNAIWIIDDNGGTAYQSKETGKVGHWIYEQTIPFGDTITELDMTLIYEIFRVADKTSNPDNTLNYELGEVFVGTQSHTDISDTYSYNRFYNEYIDTDTGEVSFSSVERGNRLKVIDNNNDGKADFVFKIRYTLDEIVDSVTKNDNTTWYFESLADNHGYAIDWMDEYKPALNDVVLYNIADGKIHIQKAESDNVVVNRVSFTNSTIDTVAGDTRNQSGITNGTEMDEDITKMDEKVEYIVYFDKYTNIRAYKLAQGNQYGLLTEMYGQSSQQGQFVTTPYMFVELMGSEDKAPAEYQVLNSNPFVNSATQTLPSAKPYAGSRYNALQRAVAHLGLEAICSNEAPTFNQHVWNGAGNTTHAINGNGIYLTNSALRGYSEEFGWGTATGVTTSGGTTPITASTDFSWTNVAKYTKSDNGVNLYTASEWATDKFNNYLYYSDLNNDDVYEKYTKAQWIAQYRKNNASVTEAQADTAFEAGLAGNAGSIKVVHVYAVDYVQLAVQDVATGKTRLPIDNNYLGYKEGYSGPYVNAVDTTEYYIVSHGSVRHFTGRNNVPALTVAGNGIRAMYAVARNTSGDQANTDYWIADVIVIEIDDEGYAFDDVIIGYWNGSQISRAYNQFIDALSAEEDGVEVTVRPTNSWGSQWTGVADGSSRTYWAYGMVGTSKDEDGNILAALRPLGTTDDPYNKNGVYAGTVTHVDGLRNYIDVDLDGDGKSDDSVAYTGTLAYIIGNNGRNLGTVRISDLTNERIIYVKNSAGRLSYIVDVSYNKNSWNTPSWLAVDLFNDIIEEQKGQWTGNYVEVTEKLWAINLHSSDPQNLKRETLDEYKALRNLLQDMYDHPSNYGLNRADQDKIQATLTSANKAIALSEPWVNANEAYAAAIEEIETAMVASLKVKDTNHRITDYVAVLSDEVVTFTFTDNGTSYSNKTMVWVLDQWAGNLRAKANTEYGAGGGSAVPNTLSTYVTALKNQTDAVATAYVGVLDDQQTTQGSNITNKTFLGDQDPDFKNGILVLSGTAVANTGLVRELYGAQLSETTEPFSVLPISFQEYAGDLQDKGYTRFDVTVYNPALLHETGEDSIVRDNKSWSDLADFAILLENGKDVKVVITGVNTDGSAVANPDRVVINIDNNFIGTVGTASAS